MRFSKALKTRYGNEYDVLNLPPDQFREYLDNLKRRYEDNLRSQKVEQEYTQQVGSDLEEQFEEMAPSERQELVDEGYLEAQKTSPERKLEYMGGREWGGYLRADEVLHLLEQGYTIRPEEKQKAQDKVKEGNMRPTWIYFTKNK